MFINCKYEKLANFCFICGLISHTKRFCKKKLEVGKEDVSKEWGQWLRAPPRRAVGGGRSKWLRENGDDGWDMIGQGSNSKGDNFRVQNPDSSHGEIPLRDQRYMTANFIGNVDKSARFPYNSGKKAVFSNLNERVGWMGG